MKKKKFDILLIIKQYLITFQRQAVQKCGKLSTNIK